MQIAGRLRFLSKPSSKRALTEISNLAWGSNTRSRGRSFAALVPLVTPRKIRKWVSKDERQAMVKEFINKHRSGNSGKFPTASYIKKEVGGSYYFVRKILQEVEYKSKLSSSNTGNESSKKKDLPKENEGSNEFKENMSSYITVDTKIREDGQAVAINGMVTSDSSCMHSEVKKGTKVSVSFDKIKSVPDIDSSKSKAEDHQQSPEYSCPEKPEDVKEETCKPMLDIDGSKSKAEEHQPSSEYPSTKKLEDLKEETPYESLLDIDVSKSKAERHQSLLDLETFAREDLTEKQMEKIPKKSSIWVTQIDLHRLFHALSAGVIEEVRVQRDKGFGFVRYSNHSEAALAIQMGNTQSILYGKQIKCSWGSKPTPPGTSSNPLPPPAPAPMQGLSSTDLLAYERQLAMSKMGGVHALMHPQVQLPIKQGSMGMGAAGASQAIYDGGFQNVAAAQQLMYYQ